MNSNAQNWSSSPGGVHDSNTVQHIRRVGRMLNMTFTDDQYEAIYLAIKAGADPTALARIIAEIEQFHQRQAQTSTVNEGPSPSSDRENRPNRTAYR